MTWAKRRWYRLRDGLRDRVWELARRIDPAVAEADLDRARACEQLQRYLMAGSSQRMRLYLTLFASAEEIAERALMKAAREGFDGSLAEAADRAREAVR